MRTRLQEILDVEGISKAELGRVKGLNTTTIHFLCKDKKYHKRARSLTKNNIINALEELGRSKRKYKLSEVFPD
jgi:hypothetical protein